MCVNQGTKIYGKSILRYVPIIGWAWVFCECIFLKREWDHDKRIIARDLAYLTEYPPGYYVTVRLDVSRVFPKYVLFSVMLITVLKDVMPIYCFYLLSIFAFAVVVIP